MGPIQSGINQIIQSALHGAIVTKGAQTLSGIDKSTSKIKSGLGKLSAKVISSKDAGNVKPLSKEQKDVVSNTQLASEYEKLNPRENFDTDMESAMNAYNSLISGNNAMVERASRKLDQINKFAGIEEMLRGDRGEILG